MIPKVKKTRQTAQLVSEHRSPNLSTILMIENYLRRHRASPVTLSSLRNKLPKQVMHQTLKVALEYLYASGKIVYGPRGIQWVYVEPAHLQRMLRGSLELA